MFGAKLSWCQIVRCQIVLVPNCPGAKLSTFIILVPNCLLLLFWCQIVRFIILLPNCPTIRLGRFWNSNCRKLHLRIWKCSSPSLAPRTILRPLTAWTQRPVQSSYCFHYNAWLWSGCYVFTFLNFTIWRPHKPSQSETVHAWLQWSSFL